MQRRVGEGRVTNPALVGYYPSPSLFLVIPQPVWAHLARAISGLRACKVTLRH